jgi:hypothetical protein
MLDHYITDHAEMRKQQRGFRNADIELLIGLGEPFGSDGFRISRKSALYEISLLKDRIQRLERLAGSIAVVSDGYLVTVHHGENAKSNRRRKSGGRRHEH